jgi:hypothetical protein
MSGGAEQRRFLCWAKPFVLSGHLNLEGERNHEATKKNLRELRGFVVELEALP